MGRHIKTGKLKQKYSFCMDEYPMRHSEWENMYFCNLGEPILWSGNRQLFNSVQLKPSVSKWCYCWRSCRKDSRITFHFPQGLVTTNSTGHTAFASKFPWRDDWHHSGNNREERSMFTNGVIWNCHNYFPRGGYVFNHIHLCICWYVGWFVRKKLHNNSPINTAFCMRVSCTNYLHLPLCESFRCGEGWNFTPAPIHLWR